MDRRHALEQLEVVRSETDLSDPELADAINALEDDIPARQEVDRRLELDQAIASAMQQVTPPSDLRDKLMAACENQSVGQGVSKSGSRRKVLTALALTALTLLAAVFLIPAKPRVTFAQIIGSAPRDAAEVGQRNENARLANMPVALDRLLRNRPSLAWPSEPKSQPTSLVIAGRNWVVIATPKDQIEEVPNLIDGATVGGIDDGFAYRAWESEGFVYVLFVPGTRNDLNRVYAQEFGTTAA